MVGSASNSGQDRDHTGQTEVIMRTFKRFVAIAAITAALVAAWPVGAWAATAIEYGLIF